MRNPILSTVLLVNNRMHEIIESGDLKKYNSVEAANAAKQLRKLKKLIRQLLDFYDESL